MRIVRMLYLYVLWDLWNPDLACYCSSKIRGPICCGVVKGARLVANAILLGHLHCLLKHMKCVQVLLRA